MKKFLALLFVCAGLTAMAATPRQIQGKMFNHQTPSKAMVMKSNKFINDINKPAQTLQDFGREMKAEGKLISKAPRRFTNVNDLVGTYIFFGDLHAWSQDQTTYDITIDTVPYMTGGWDVVFSENSNDNFLSFSGLYNGEEAEDTVIIYTDEQAFLIPNWTSVYYDYIQGPTSSGMQQRRNDTIYEAYVMSEPYFLTGEQKHIQGTIDENGWFIFDDGMVVYTERVINQYSRGNLTASDTAAYLDVYEDIILVPPTGKHEFAVEETGGKLVSNNVFMYQQNDSIVRVWNLWAANPYWTGGGYGNYMLIYPDGTMNFPSFQVVYEMGPAELNYYASQYSQYDWTGSQSFYNLACNYDFDADQATGYSGADVAGTVTSTEIKWDASAVGNFLNQGADNEGLGFADSYINNRLYFTDGETFMIEKSADPVITSQLTDEAVIVTATAVEGAQVVLAIIDEEGNPTVVENPCTIERTDEDQVVTFGAMAMEEGKNPSELVITQVEIPALEVVDPWMLGDVNHDKTLDVLDVTALIAWILGNDPGVFYIEQANVDQDEEGALDVGDVTALIGLILNN